ncbi:hypothetical protein GCM10025868_08570 [Angustibacter aerolatus]|uniref:Uncharacterized protein n=1 Tax=Angustibacter aerolatus TaxID=1162965 RepID=A0ABQ6JFC9_9ACTN|nr:hypothetical protein GCM10025868_08570 [Angustibacter aerolatus]
MPAASRPPSRHTVTTTTPSSRTRAAVERASRPLLTRLSGGHRAIPFLLVLALMVAGVFVGGVPGALLVLVVVLFIGWLLYLGWPALTTAERMGRFAVLAVAVAVGVVQALPRG